MNPENGRYKLQGDVYFFGLLYGIMWKMPEGSQVKEVRFVVDWCYKACTSSSLYDLNRGYQYVGPT